MQQLDAIRFNHRVQRERGPGFPLAPAAVAAMHEQGPGRHAVAHSPAGAAAFERGGGFAGGHGSWLLYGLVLCVAS